MLEKREHRFVRYADDITIYVGSKRAAERVMTSTSEFIERRLKLRVNRSKSSVALAFHATLLGFGFLRRDGETRMGWIGKGLLAHRSFLGPSTLTDRRLLA